MSLGGILAILQVNNKVKCVEIFICYCRIQKQALYDTFYASFSQLRKPEEKIWMVDVTNCYGYKYTG